MLTTGIGIGTSSVSSKAVLDVVSTTKGFLPPRMTTTQRDAISSPPTGLTIYNTTTNALSIFNGTSWQEAISGYSESDPQVGTLTASNFCTANAGATAIDCTNATIVLSSLATTGTPSSSTYLRGDGAWSTISALSGGSTGYGAVWSSATALTYDTALYVDTTNHRVGIGTASPATRLHIYQAGNVELAVDSPAANTASLNFYSAGTAVGGFYRPVSSNDIRMYDAGDIMTWQRGGNVGIGTTSPLAALHVAADQNGGTLITASNAGPSSETSGPKK